MVPFEGGDGKVAMGSQDGCLTSVEGLIGLTVHGCPSCSFDRLVSKAVVVPSSSHPAKSAQGQPTGSLIGSYKTRFPGFTDWVRLRASGLGSRVLKGQLIRASSDLKS